MKELGVGIIGTGWVSDEYIRSFGLNAHTRVAAICSRDEERGRSKAAQHGLSECAVVTRPEDLVSLAGVDVVCINTPNYLHAEQTILAAKAGKHIVIEKPIATDWQDMRRMKEAVDAAGVTTIVGFVLRWNPLFKTIKKLLADDVLGKVNYAEVDYLHAITPAYNCYPWSVKRETGGSILQVGGCHAVDGLRWFIDDECVEVVALSGRYRQDFEQDTTVTFLAKFASGSMGKVTCSYDVVSPYIYNVEVFGSKGSVINNRVWAKQAFPGQEDWITIPTTTPDSGDVSHHPFPEEVDHFVDCILTGRKTIVDLDDAIKTFEIIEAADRSAAANGIPVRLPLGW
jgi:predicted dehydrogenase